MRWAKRSERGKAVLYGLAGKLIPQEITGADGKPLFGQVPPVIKVTFVVPAGQSPQPLELNTRQTVTIDGESKRLENAG